MDTTDIPQSEGCSSTGPENDGKSENEEKSENEGKLEIEWKSGNEKAKELLNKAIACCDYGDYQEALSLIDTARHVIVQEQKEEADYNLKIYSTVIIRFAKDALKAKDIETAERYAIEADEMYPSEEAKTLLAKIQLMKASIKESKVKSDDNTNYTEKKENESNNDSAKIERAECCLKIAKEAFVVKDIAKAERLATRADRIYPSEEAKILLAKIQLMKASVKEPTVKNDDDTSYTEKKENSKNDSADKEQSDYCHKTAKEALENKEKECKAEHSMTTEVRKPEYSLRTREGIVVRPKQTDDSKINPNYYENKENRANNDSANSMANPNREQADYCLKCAKDAIECKDIEKAEKLATKADRMYPSEEGKTLLAKVLQMKASIKELKVKRDKNTNYTENKENNNDRANKEQADYCPKTAKEALENKEKEIRKVYKLEHSMTPRGRSTEVRKPEYSLRTREKSVDRPNKSDEQNVNSNEYKNKDINNSTNINPNYYKNKENRANNDSANGTANREQADYCLKCAKDSFEANDIENAERLATKADRMHPSEEAKSILAKILQIKSYVKDREVKSDNTRYSAGHEENKGEAQKSLDIAFTARAKGDIEKCRRFLRKAQSFDRSIDIDVYMYGLDKKKAQEEHEKIISERMKRERQEEEQRKAAEITKNESLAYKLFKAAENAASTSYSKTEELVYRALGLNPSLTEAHKLKTKIQEAKAQEKYAQKDPKKTFSDCLKNEPLSSEAQKTCKNNSPPPEAKKNMTDLYEKFKKSDNSRTDSYVKNMTDLYEKFKKSDNSRTDSYVKNMTDLYEKFNKNSQ